MFAGNQILKGEVFIILGLLIEFFEGRSCRTIVFMIQGILEYCPVFLSGCLRGMGIRCFYVFDQV